MKKTILTFGGISGVVSSAMMLATMPFIDRIGFDRGYIVGYTGIVLSFLLVFVGIRSYRDNQSGGQISFGKAFLLGLGIVVISCLFYVITWEALYFTVMHDFMDKFSTYAVEKVRATGGSEAMVQKKIEEMAQMKKMYENPLFNFAMTFLEPFPVGLVMSLVSAGLLRRRPGQTVAMTQSA